MLNNIEDRVTNLETVLKQYVQLVGAAQAKTEQSLLELKEEMSDFKGEMSEFKNTLSITQAQSAKEMQDFKNEMSDFKNEMSDFKNEMSDFKNEMSDFKNEMSDFKNGLSISLAQSAKEMQKFKEEAIENRNEFQKKLAESSDRMGRFLEDFVSPSMRTVAKEFLGVKDVGHSFERAVRISSKDKSRSKEFDAVVIGDNKLIINETKCTPKIPEIERFMDGLEDVFDYFPECSGYEVIPVFATLKFHDSVLKYLTKRRIYAMGIKENVMTILNPDL